MTAKYGIPYFSNYINSDMNPSDVRSMAILGTQNVIYKDKFGRISKNEIRHLVSQWKKNPDKDYSIMMNGTFVDIIDMFEVPYENYDKYVRINIGNGQSQNFSYDHKCVIVRDDKLTEEFAQNVTSGDYFVLAKRGYNESEIGTYESGKIVGYYLAEGWTTHNDTEVVFAINIDRTDICDEIVKFFNDNFSCRVCVDTWADKHCHEVKVFSKAACSFVRGFISGDRATNKHIETTCYDTSLSFRQGIYDGYLDTDGSKRHKIFAHTTNKNLCADMIQLFATIGKYFTYRENNKNTRYFKADKSDLTTFTSYELKLYEPTSFNDDYYIVPVNSVELLDATRINKVYNFTVNTAEHLYELPNGIITHQCCRLRLDLRELRHKSGGYFGSGDSTGSIGVVTINMPRLAYTSKDEAEFYTKLDKLMDIAARSLETKRKVVSQFLEEGLYPYTKRYLGKFDNHFSTIGLVGMNEACLNAAWVKDTIASEAGYRFSCAVLDHMRNKLSDYQEKYGNLFNLEATPAESTSFRFAKHDVEAYPDIITAGTKTGGTPYYTNSSHLPVDFTEDIFTALDIQDGLQTKYTSGTVFHAFLGEKLPSWQSAMKLTRTIAENYRLPYFTFSPTYSVCKNHGYIAGEHFTCPDCGEVTEVYSRITGYYRAVQYFNDGKAQEYKDRTEYVINSIPEKFNTEDTHDESPYPTASVKKITLFATTTCPNCAQAKKQLTAAGIDYDVVIADGTDPVGTQLAIDCGVKQAPTLVLPTGEVISNVSNIIRYIRENK